MAFALFANTGPLAAPNETRNKLDKIKSRAEEQEQEPSQRPHPKTRKKREF
jgi:hypothetical protein